MTEKFQTLHPDPDKQGVNIAKSKYKAVKRAIIKSLKSAGELTFRELQADVDKKLVGSFDGSIGWYYTTIKLDLEARNIIERIPDSKPQRLRLVSKKGKQ